MEIVYKRCKNGWCGKAQRRNITVIDVLVLLFNRGTSDGEKYDKNRIYRGAGYARDNLETEIKKYQTG